MTNPLPPPTWAKLNLLLPATAATIFALFAALYRVAPAIYARLIDLWSFLPFRYPFLDSEFYVSNRQCFALGIDVYVTNPCDVMNRVFSNSPFCLRLILIPANLRWNPLFGLILCLGFFASLAALPRITGRHATAWSVTTLLSLPVVYAVERANFDLPIFTMAVIIMLLLERELRLRLIGYALILFAFLVKLYPITLIILALREKSRPWLIVIWGAALLTIATYAATYYGELLRMVRNLPNPGPFGYDIGARLLTQGLAQITSLTPIATIGLPIQTLISAAAAIAIARRANFIIAYETLTTRQVSALLTGSLLLCGCFFSGVSVGYRAIHLLLVLPGLLAIRAVTPDRRQTRAWRHAPQLILLIIYSPILFRLTGAYDGPPQPAWVLATLAVWLAREAAWWWLITILLAVLWHFVWQAPVLAPLRKR